MKKLTWLDIQDIAIELEEHYPDEDILNLSFTRLRDLVITLDSFDDDINKSNEKILEGIQANWLEERD